MSTEAATGIPVWTVGDRLRKARESAGMEQGDLANRIGISRNSVINYEKGHTRPRRIVLNAWSVATGVPLAWLRDGSTAATGEYRRSRRHLRLIPPVPLTATG